MPTLFSSSCFTTRLSVASFFTLLPNSDRTMGHQSVTSSRYPQHREQRSSLEQNQHQRRGKFTHQRPRAKTPRHCELSAASLRKWLSRDTLASMLERSCRSLKSTREFSRMRRNSLDSSSRGSKRHFRRLELHRHYRHLRLVLGRSSRAVLSMFVGVSTVATSPRRQRSSPSFRFPFEATSWTA